LRSAIGVTAIAQGVLYLQGVEAFSAAAVTIGVFFIVAGAALLAGFATPLAGLLATVENLAIAAQWISVRSFSAPGARIVALEMAILAVALSLLGPGAYSLDARLFGRREIVIPPASGPPDY